MNYLDIIICAIIAFFAIRSTLRGAIRETFSLLALIAGVIVSCRYYAMVSAFLVPHIENPWARTIIALTGIFSLVYIGINIAGWLTAKLIKFIRLSFLDRFAGFFCRDCQGISHCLFFYHHAPYARSPGQQTAQRVPGYNTKHTLY